MQDQHNTQPTNKTTNDARQGSTTSYMRIVLYISLALTITGLVAVALFSDII